ncbi:MAG: putative bifunctional diguanylate cyclase/phosphodiesterase [Blastococcus sp.]
MRPRPRRAELPLDVRRRDGARSRDGVLVEAVLDALPSPTLLIDADGKVLLANSAWTNAAEVLDDDRFRIGVGGDYFGLALQVDGDAGTHALIERVRELSRGERDLVSVDHAVPHSSGTRWYHVQASRVDQAGHIVVTHTDVTSRVAAEQTSSWQARHDHLTGLPNRARLHELIDAELRRPGKPSVAVLFLDVDGFKDVNDSLGHEVGDELLRQMAARLDGETRAQDTVGRLGGDEFVVLCSDCDADGAQLLAARFQRTFEKPFVLAGRPIRLSTSIGIAAAAAGRAETVRSTELVRDADLAMYAAKAAGRNRVRGFSSDLRTRAQQRLQLAAELRDAIEGDQLVLHYQPTLHLATGAHTGVEALVRWQHPERGLLPPSEFIALAEQHDLIAPLTRWVLRTATRQAVGWQRAGLSLVTGVNISAAHFSSGTLVADVTAALVESGLPADRLLVELTETCVAEDPERAAAELAELRVSGVEVAIDDFGHGFSSLGQLVSLPAGVLKIDRSLVAGADGRSSQSGAAIAAVVGLAAAFGMRCLAEGVETAVQQAVAAELGCTHAQGFYICRPLPAEDVLPWMTARQHRMSTRATPAGLLPAAR